MSRYIDADALKTKKRYSAEFHENVVAVAEIDWMPTIDAVPVVHGEWINVGERLPERSENVLVANCRGKQWDIDKAWWNGMYFDRCGKKPFFHVTHWMPLPEPPNYGAKMRTVTDCHTLEEGER